MLNKSALYLLNSIYSLLNLILELKSLHEQTRISINSDYKLIIVCDISLLMYVFII